MHRQGNSPTVRYVVIIVTAVAAALMIFFPEVREAVLATPQHKLGRALLFLALFLGLAIGFLRSRS